MAVQLAPVAETFLAHRALVWPFSGVPPQMGHVALVPHETLVAVGAPEKTFKGVKS